MTERYIPGSSSADYMSLSSSPSSSYSSTGSAFSSFANIIPGVSSAIYASNLASATTPSQILAASVPYVAPSFTYSPATYYTPPRITSPSSLAISPVFDFLRRASTVGESPYPGPRLNETEVFNPAYYRDYEKPGLPSVRQTIEEARTISTPGMDFATMGAAQEGVAADVIATRLAPAAILSTGETVGGPPPTTVQITPEGAEVAMIPPSNQQRVTKALSESGVLPKKESYLVDLFKPSASQGLAASQTMLSKMRDENKAAAAKGEKLPHLATDLQIIGDDVDRLQTGLSFIEGYLSDVTLPESPTANDVANAVTLEIMAERGIRQPSGLSLAAQQDYDVALKSATRRVTFALRSGDAASLEVLPQTLQSVFDEYSSRVAGEVTSQFSSDLVTGPLRQLPLGYSLENAAGLNSLADDYDSASSQLSGVVGLKDPRVKQMQSNARIVRSWAEGAPIRAEAFMAQDAPLAYALEKGGESAAHLAGRSPETLAAYTRDLAGSPQMTALDNQLNRAISAHANREITNEQLQQAVNRYTDGVATLTSGMNPTVKNTWYGSLNADGIDLSFEKLAGISALLLGLYQGTIGKERDREKQLEDLMELERFRTDEQLRLYGGRLGLQQQYAGTTELGAGTTAGAGTAPAGSSALASIADRVTSN